MIKRILKSTFSLLNVDHVKLGTKWNYKNVISPYYRVYYIDRGEGEVSDVAATVSLEPGYLYIIPSFTLCNLYCADFLSQYFIQFFEENSDGISLFSSHRSVFKIKASANDIANIKRLLELNPGRGINRSDNPKIYEKNIFYKEYQDLNNRQATGAFLETQGIILQLVGRFLSPEIIKYQESVQIPNKIMEAIGYILINLHENLTVSLLAERANQNPDYFSRQFQQYTGERPVTYIQGKRVERCQYLMVTTRLTFSQIAAQSGFENVFYFSKIFKKLTGMSPGQYRKQSELLKYYND